MKNIIGFSGGKNSTTMLLMMLEDGYKIDDIVFADTGMEYPEMYDYIRKVEKYLCRKITFLKPLKTYKEAFYTRFQRGKFKGKIYGFPTLINKWCVRYLKLAPLDNYTKSIKGEFVMWVGITIDEPKRYERLIKFKNRGAYLYENKITDNDCLIYLKSKNLLNPLYEKFTRLGCWICGNQRINDLRILRKDYPSLWQEALDLEKDSRTTFNPNRLTFKKLDERFAREDMQLIFNY